jgi:hypothetical protein
MYQYLDVPSFNAQQDWLHNVCDVYLVNFFFSLNGLGHIVWKRSGPVLWNRLSLAGGFCKLGTNAREK